MEQTEGVEPTVEELKGLLIESRQEENRLRWQLADVCDQIGDYKELLSKRTVDFSTLYSMWEKRSGRPLIKGSLAHSFAEDIIKELTSER